MDLTRFKRRGAFEWEIAPRGAMRVPGVIYASALLLEAMEDKVFEQVSNVAMLPGIVTASYAMPDAHWGYGFPIGGVAAFDPLEGGVVSAGGVGFDISCGVRCLHTGLTAAEVRGCQKKLADVLYQRIPAGLGSTGTIRLGHQDLEQMLTGGARWAVEQGWAPRLTSSASRSRGRCAAPSRSSSRRTRSAARPTRWAPWAAATTTWRCSRWRRCSTPGWPPPSACTRATWW